MKQNSTIGRMETCVQLTGSSETSYRVTIEEKRDGPRLATQTVPNPATRKSLMDRLQDHTVFSTARLDPGYRIMAAT